MNPMEKAGWTPLPHSDEDLERARSVPDTPQTRAASYKLAWDDEIVFSKNASAKIPMKLWVKPGEAISVRDAVNGMIVISANDAAAAIGIEAVGSASGLQPSADMMWSRTDLKPSDVDVAEIYDGFTIHAVEWLEALGLTPAAIEGAGEDAAQLLDIDGAGALEETQKRVIGDVDHRRLRSSARRCCQALSCSIAWRACAGFRNSGAETLKRP